MAALAVILTATLAARRCTVDPEMCLYNVDFTFAEAYRIRYGEGIRDGDYDTILGNPKFQEALCDPDMWKKRSEACGGCAHELEVTKGLGEEWTSRRICLAEVEMLPHTDGSHLTPDHPNHMKEMELLVSTSTRWGQDGCRSGSWSSLDDMSDKIVLTPNCWGGAGGALPEPYSKGAPALIHMMSSTSYLKEENENYPPFDKMTNSQYNNMTVFNAFSFPVHNLFQAIKDAKADHNITTYGRLISNCGKSFDPLGGIDSVDTSKYASDTCPGWKMSHKDLCSKLSNETRRLCTTCPLQVQDPATGENLPCLYSHDLTPLRAETQMSLSFTFPLKEKVIYFQQQSMARYCDPRYYNESWKGRIVMFGPGHVHGCTRTDAILAAQKAGVKAVINTVPDRVRGASYGLAVPTATTANPVDMIALSTFMKLGEVVGNSAWERELLILKPDHVPLPVTPSPPADVDLVKDPEKDNSSVVEQAGVIASIVLIPVLVIAIFAKTCWARKTTVPLPDATGVSLSTSSTLLSMAMAVVLTVITFVLTLNAGQRGVDTASDSGRNVAQLATDMNTQNVKTLTDGTLVQMLSTARGAFKSRLTRKRDTGMESVIYRNKDRGEWGWSRYAISEIPNLFTVQEDPIVKGSITNKWAVYMREGGYLDSEGHRNSNYDYSRTVSSSGSKDLYDPLTKLWYSDIPKDQNYTALWLVNTYQADLDVEGRFEFSQYQMRSPSWKGNYGPFISYVKAFNTGGLPLGHYVVSEPFFHYSYAVQASLESHISRNPLAENMSFCFYREDGVIFAMTPGTDDSFQSLDYFGPFLGGSSWDPSGDPEKAEDNTVGYSLTTVWNTRQPEINAMANLFMQKFGTIVAKKNVEGGTTAVTETFDQKEYVSLTTDVIFHANFDGNQNDVSGTNWDTRVQCDDVNSTACASLKTQGKFGGSLALDGKGTFLVLPYLTQRTPRVAATKKSTHTGAWMSENLSYNDSAVHDGVDDVIMTWANSDGSIKRPVIRERFHLGQEHSISMWVKPSASMTQTKQKNATLFADTNDHLAASYRLTGDAQLLIAANMFGCITNPVEGGLPTDEWTHIVVSVSFAKKRLYCSVSLNGRLHSLAPVSFKIDMAYYLHSYRIGQNFAGEVDDLRFHNRTMSDDDAESMHANSRLAPVKSKMFSTVAIGIDSHKISAGFPAMVYSLSVPNSDIVREAEAAAERLKRNLETEEDNTNKQLHQNSMETVCIVLVVLLIAALLFITFNHLLTKPFAAFAVEIDAVAQIDVDGMEATDTSSILLEINVMAKAMNTLVKNMKEFKSFMPLSMQECVQGEDSSQDQEESVPNGTGSVLSRHSSRSRSRRDSANRTMTSEESFAIRSNYHNKAREATELLVANLMKRKMSFLCVNVKGFLRSMNGASERDVIQGHSGYIQHCIDSSQTRGGLPETFSGDRVLITFNGVKSCSGHPEAAAEVSLLLRDKWPEGYGEGVNMSLAAGSVRAGNIGAQAMRRYTMLGSTVAWVHGLERYGAYNNIQIAADSVFADMVKGRFEHRHFSAILCPKHSTRTVIVTAFQAIVRCTDDEWMYQLENATKLSSNGAYNAWVECLVRAKWEQASKLLEKEDLMHLTAADVNFGDMKNGLLTECFTPEDVKYLC